MQSQILTRRHLLSALLSMPLAAVALRASAAELICSDGGLDAEQKKQRAAQHYVDLSPHGAKKNCANCAVFQAEDNACGSCVLVPGPIHPAAYCNAWTDMV